MAWQIKRYGGHIQPGGPGYSDFVESRFLTVVLLFLATVASYVFSGRWYAQLYIPLWFLYTVIGFLPEFFKRLQEIPLMIFSAITLITAHGFSLHPFWRRVSWQSERTVDQPAMLVFTVFCIAVLVMCITLMYIRYRQDSIEHDQSGE
ncbi:hypothetical protein [Pseudoteredinibacter isoporae]|uniref:Magnesium-transporting ATPase (P-type) n=1 Tax=Pseudoteredinibacter isoporae TaxID=570281 RepID=A0A7X0MVQ5_9GAMM|nr:hypothetical protein [Pseudoteredinibacter isoporae]MBB6521370.1 magnesium-transporting ATPase (P-type) [Pseudoteredinibacter isoporae]NHO86925.1 hypothetical protein [Pseudoteredinibacter isoporae]NIB24622.1 hypothetical protein [Pseudoteredinibacter isoporae]